MPVTPQTFNLDNLLKEVRGKDGSFPLQLRLNTRLI